MPVKFLQKQGVRDQRYQGEPAVRISYRGADGQDTAVRYRVALEKSEELDERFKWRTGSKTSLYGLWRLEKIKKAGWVVLVEGESDAQTLWYHDIPALGIPGVDTWKPAWAEHLEGVEKVFAVIEPDHGGETLREKLGASDIRSRLYLVHLGEHKDPNGLYLSDRENFKDRIISALKEAPSWVEQHQVEREAEARKAWEAVESGIDAFIAQRHDKRVKEEGRDRPLEEARATSERRHDARRREVNRWKWVRFFDRMAKSHAALAADYQRRAETLCEENRGEGGS